jgi:RNA polymerase sigma-70 factor (ECF subfamily)
MWEGFSPAPLRQKRSEVKVRPQDPTDSCDPAISRASLNLSVEFGIPVSMLTAAMSDLMTETTTAEVAATTDAALARLAASGDAGAFESIYRRHAGRVHGVIVRLVGAHGVRAEDLTQEAFVRAWQALPKFRFESAVSTWLHRLAVTTALMELRRRRSGPRFSEDEDAIDDLGVADSAGNGTALSMDLERAVATLPPRARAVLVLHDVEGWKHEEIAGELGMAIGSSKAQLHRARQLLRGRLGGEA